MLSSHMIIRQHALRILFAMPLLLGMAFIVSPQDAMAFCTTPKDCPSGRICVDGICRLPHSDSDRTCKGKTKTFTLDNKVLQDSVIYFDQTEVQISHTRKGVPVKGEKRTINLRNNIPAQKFVLLEKAMLERCAKTPDPLACQSEWYKGMEFVVHTIEPKHYSFIKWGPWFQQAGLDFEPLFIPIIQKDVSGKVSKAILANLSLIPIAFNVERARCHINAIGYTVDYRETDFNIRMQNGSILVELPLESGFSPTLKCEGEAVAGFGIHSWGWADTYFPDVDLDNMKLTVRLGLFKNVNGLPIYNSVSVDFATDLDLNNVPEFTEDIFDFFKDYRNRVRNKVEEKIGERLRKTGVKEGLGKALVAFIEKTTDDSVTKICDVNSSGNAIIFEYEIDEGIRFPRANEVPIPRSMQR